MTKLHNRRGGFTLIELMIVVAIIGILAAIAIPNFLRFQLRSKTGEAKTNLAALRTAEESYFAEYGVYISAAANPAAVPGSSKAAWGAAPAGFDTVGWAPEGDVFYQYAVSIAGGAFNLEAAGDLDGAAPTSDFGYIHPDAAGATAAVGVINACVAAGIYSPGGSLLNTVGPCAAADGQSEF